jgi:hypothetical protein
MIAHLRSVFYTGIFFVGMQLMITDVMMNEQKSFLLAIAILGVAIFAGWNVGKSVIYSFLPFAIGISSIGLLFFIDNVDEKRLFGLLVAMLFYATLFGIKRIRKNPYDMTARSIFSASLIATIFLFYSVVYGFYINFNIPLWLFLITHFVFVMMVTFVSLRAYSSDYRRIVLYSAAIAFSMIQLVWMSNFWPFGYLTTAVVSLVFYYVLWDLVQMEFLEILSKKRVIVTLIFCIVLAIAVLLSTQWLLVY